MWWSVRDEGAPDRWFEENEEIGMLSGLRCEAWGVTRSQVSAKRVITDFGIYPPRRTGLVLVFWLLVLNI
jgi:hypothetical protein